MAMISIETETSTTQNVGADTRPLDVRRSREPSYATFLCGLKTCLGIAFAVRA